MPVPSTEALVNVRASGGSQAAGELGKVTKAQGGIAKSQKGVQQEFAKGIQTTGLISLGREMTLATGLSGSMTTGIVGLITVMKAAMTSAGGLAVALSIIAAVAGAVWAAIAALSKKQEDAAKAMKEANDKLTDQIRLFEEAEKGNVKLTATQQKLIDTLKEARQTQTKNTIKTMEAAAAEKQLDADTLSLWEAYKLMITGVFGLDAAYDKLIKSETKQRVEAAQLRADAEALGKGYKDVTDMVQRTAKEQQTFTKSFEGMRDEARKSALALEALDPAATFRIANDEIEQMRRKQLQALDDLVLKSKEKLEAVALINAAAANKTALVWEQEVKRVADANKQAAEKSKGEWDKATGSMTAGIEKAATSMFEMMRDSSKSTEDVFKAMTDTIIKEIERMIAKEIALQIARRVTASIGAGGGAGGAGAGTAGGAGGGMGGMGGGAGMIVGYAAKWLAGLYKSSDKFAFRGVDRVPMQHGGTIPGPEGRPQLVMAHGGETFTTPTGRGGAPAGGGKTVNVTIATGILTPDSLRTAQRQLSRMQGSAGEQVFPVR